MVENSNAGVHCVYIFVYMRERARRARERGSNC